MNYIDVKQIFVVIENRQNQKTRKKHFVTNLTFTFTHTDDVNKNAAGTFQL